MPRANSLRLQKRVIVSTFEVKSYKNHKQKLFTYIDALSDMPHLGSMQPRNNF